MSLTNVKLTKRCSKKLLNKRKRQSFNLSPLKTEKGTKQACPLLETHKANIDVHKTHRKHLLQRLLTLHFGNRGT